MQGRDTQDRGRMRIGYEVVLLALLVALLVGEWHWFPGPEGRHDATETISPPGSGSDPTGLRGGRAPRVLIAGDSIADQFGSQALPALRQAGVEVQLVTWWGWGLLTREQYDLGATNPNPPANAMISVVRDAVAEFEPDVVAIYSNHNYWPPYPRDAAGREIEPGNEPLGTRRTISPEFSEMVRTQLTELVHSVSSTGADVYLIKPVPWHRGTAADNPIWSTYLELRDELGFGVIDAGDALAGPGGRRRGRLDDCTGRSVDAWATDGFHLSYRGAGAVGTRLARALADIVGVPLAGSTAVSEAPAALLPVGTGYRLVTCDGSTFRSNQGGVNLGGATFGENRRRSDPVVAATTPGNGHQAWVVTRAGQVGSLGGAPTYGHAVDLGDRDRAVGIAATAGGHGYWIATRRGAVQRFGDATDLGDLRDPRADHGGATPAEGQFLDELLADDESQRVVAMSGTPDRRGYWLLTASGHVAAFGSAQWLGDVSADPPKAPVVSIAAQSNGNGYWILDAAGKVHPFGTASQHGSAAGLDLVRILGWSLHGAFDTQHVPHELAPTTAVTLLSTASGGGYWIWLSNGAVCRFGDAPVLGGLHRAQLDTAMRLQGLAFYGLGPCQQQPGNPLAPPDDIYAPTTG